MGQEVRRATNLNVAVMKYVYHTDSDVTVWNVPSTSRCCHFHLPSKIVAVSGVITPLHALE